MQPGLLSSSGLQHSGYGLWKHLPLSRLFNCSSSGAKQGHHRGKQPFGHRQTCKALSGPIDVRVEDKRKSLLRFVQDVQPTDILEHFQSTAPPPVLDAMVRVVTNQLGALPPTYFNVTISASVEDLAQLMYSLLMLGYMYRNAQYKIDLDHLGRRSLDEDDVGSTIDFEALQKLSKKEPSPVYAEGTQLTRVSGHVLRWRKDTERTEEIDAKTYIKDCEAEISRLRAQAANLGDQLSRSIYARGSGNELLDFIKVQEPAQLKELTDNASTCVIEAMNSFVQRLLGDDLRRTESNANELARMLYFMLVVGYSLRQLEVKCDFESTFTVPEPSTGGLLQ